MTTYNYYKLSHKRRRWQLKVALYMIVIAFICGVIFGIEQGSKAVVKADSPIITIKTYPSYADTEAKRQVYDIAVSRSMKPEDIETLIKIADCESHFNPEATRVNIHKQSDGSILTTVDRGLFQLNDYFQKQVSSSCAYDLACSTNEAISIANKQGFTPWVCNKLIK